MRIALKIILTIFIIQIAGGMSNGLRTSGRENGTSIGILGALPFLIMVGGIYAVWRYIPNSSKQTTTNLDMTGKEESSSIKNSSIKSNYSIPTYKEEVYEATKRLYEWKFNIPAIIVVATDLLYKKDFTKAREILLNGENYNDKVFPIKCLLGYCFFNLFETDNSYSMAIQTSKLVDEKNISIDQMIDYYKVIGKLLPETINSLSITAKSKGDDTLSHRLSNITNTLQWAIKETK